MKAKATQPPVSAPRRKRAKRPATIPRGAKARADHCLPSADRQIVLVLQGGGALGAYQAGVYEGLHRAGIEPDWVIGTSIGAINAALIAGNRPEQRVQRLHEFWRTVAFKGLSALWPALPGMPNAWTMLDAVSHGLPGFFSPNHRAWFSPHLPLAEDAAGYYHTTELRDTLNALIVPGLLDACAPRLTVGAVNVRSGTMRYFDSRDEPVTVDHVLASGALPPAFPAVPIGNELYWDGGIYSNTPIEAVFDDAARQSALVFAVQLWSAAGAAPSSMMQVNNRQKDIQYSSRIDSHVQRQAQIHRLRHIVRELVKALPAAARAQPEVAEMAGYGCGTVMHLMRLVAPRLPDEDQTKDMDFRTARIQARWQAGIADAQRTVARRAWLDPIDATQGLVVHDLEPDMALTPVTA
jgi:NTE family protein